MHSKLYEINTANWLFELSQSYGRKINIGNIPEHELDNIKELGFNYVWMMGVWERSKIGREIALNDPEMNRLYDSVLEDWTASDVIGSAYSIFDYKPDPLIGTWGDIDKLKEKLHKRDLKLILDFIPNHTGRDHAWTKTKPDYYIQGDEGYFKKNLLDFFTIDYGQKKLHIAKGRDPFFLPWSDTAQLNYFNPDLRLAMIQQLKTISNHCDGVRCDMAMLVMNDIFSKTWNWAKNKPKKLPLTEFWVEVRSELPKFILIAEAYWDTESKLQQLGFNYTYDKKFYDRLISSPPLEVKLQLTASLDYQKRLIRFLENHDESRSTEVFSRNKLRATIILLSTLPGMKLYYNSQLEGKKIKVPVQLIRVNHEEPDQEITVFYKKILSLTKGEIFQIGEWELNEISPIHDNSAQNLIAFSWRLDSQIKFIVINLDKGLSQGRISLKNYLAYNKDYTLYDELNMQKYLRNGKEMCELGLHVILEGYGAHILTTCIK
ncbi:MAG: alpha-amylase family glycosyl hydrolase [bacterium]